MTGYVTFNAATLSAMARVSPGTLARGIQFGLLGYLDAVSDVACKICGLDAGSSCMVYVRDFETEVFFGQMRSEAGFWERDFWYSGEKFTYYWKDGGDGTLFMQREEGQDSNLRRIREDTILREIAESKLHFLEISSANTQDPEALPVAPGGKVVP